MGGLGCRVIPLCALSIVPATCLLLIVCTAHTVAPVDKADAVLFVVASWAQASHHTHYGAKATQQCAIVHYGACEGLGGYVLLGVQGMAGFG